MIHSRKEDPPRQRAARIVARSFFQELQKGGFQSRDIVSVASELIGCLNDSMRDKGR